ncbi:MAG: protein kinase [Candidatus Eisenbacteria bacterium]|nr:protein kinase [Candidatus Eisenbacteria bacterium]
MPDELPPDPDATVAHTPSSGRSSGPELPIVHAKSGEELPETAASQLKAGQILFSRYALKRVLGRGGFGVVWLADDRELDIEVALKFLADHIASSHDSVQDLKGEARRSLRLTHPNIVRIFNFIQEGSLVGISMEYVSGGSLPQIRAARGLRAFPLADLLPLVGQLCDALEYAHTKPRIVHRDLKPANLMLDSHGELKIADFGISRSISDSHTRLTSPGDSSGTLAYMSPQQMMGESPRPSDDVYSLGATIFDLVTGKPPFHSGDVVRQALNLTPSSMATRRIELGTEGESIPPEWEEVVAACLSKEPLERPIGALAVAERLGLRTVSASGSSVSGRPSSSAPPDDATMVLGSIPAGAKVTRTPSAESARTVTAPTRTQEQGSIAVPVAPSRRGMSPLLLAGALGGILLVVAGILFVPRWLRPKSPSTVAVNPPMTQPADDVPIEPPPVPAAPFDSGRAVSRVEPDPTDRAREAALEARRRERDVESARREAEDRARRLESELAEARRVRESRPPAETRVITPASPPGDPPARTPPTGTTDRAATERADAERAANDLVHRYEAAIEALDIGAYAALWQRLPDASRKALASSFRDTESLSLEITNMRIEPEGERTVVRFRENRSIQPKAGPKQSVGRDVRMTLIRPAGGDWQIGELTGS